MQSQVKVSMAYFFLFCSETTEKPSNTIVATALPEEEATTKPEIASNKPQEIEDIAGHRRQNQEKEQETVTKASSMVINVSSGSLMVVLVAFILF